MKKKIDLINFLRKYNLQNCNKKFKKEEVMMMNDDDLECFFALATFQFTDDLDHSLENADLKMKNKEESINQFFTKDKEE